MASSSAALLAVLVVAGCAGMAAAVSYTVGEAKGWVTGVDYSGWTSGKSFAVGDTLVFSYVSKVHTVTEVSQGGYTSCSGSNALAKDDSGATTVTLATPGTHYYICRRCSERRRACQGRGSAVLFVIRILCARKSLSFFCGNKKKSLVVKR
ncbi:Blue copper protein [Triticum urartu]|uniref:Blue copper protein n=1 Tax=Triticum urartu TaxID=4572 RepID=M7ZMZ6_TRIUA|nr:Blue copper protein [Triticum urartu]